MMNTTINGDIKVNRINFKSNENSKTEIIHDNKESNDESKRNSAKWMIGTTALAAGIILTVMGNKGYLGKSIKEFLVGAEKSKESLTEAALEKLPTRAEIHTEKGIHLNKDKQLVIGKGDKEKLFTGTYSYSTTKGGRRNISENVKDGVITGRVITTEKSIDKPIEKQYNYYGNSGVLREIATKKEGVRTRTFANQEALREYRAALRYTPKTPEEIKTLEEQGIKYEVVNEVIKFKRNKFGVSERTHVKEIYTYPEDSLIEKKEVFYGDRRSMQPDNNDLHSGKEITLTFRNPAKTSGQHYEINGLTVELLDDGFVTHLPGRNYHNVSINSYNPVYLPLYNRNKKPGIYEQIVAAINAEYPQDAMNMIKNGHV